MSSYVQLICLIVSFMYGIFLYYANHFNVRVIFKKNIVEKLIISILYLLVVSLLYVCFLYKINGGILHIYFVLVMIGGYVFISVKKRK